MPDASASAVSYPPAQLLAPITSPAARLPCPGIDGPCILCPGVCCAEASSSWCHSCKTLGCHISTRAHSMQQRIHIERSLLIPRPRGVGVLAICQEQDEARGVGGDRDKISGKRQGSPSRWKFSRLCNSLAWHAEKRKIKSPACSSHHFKAAKPRGGRKEA